MSGLMPGVSNALDGIEDGFQRMEGGFASSWGQTFQVFRLSPTSPSQGLIYDTPVIPTYYARPKRMSSRNVLENGIFDLIAFDAEGDSLHMMTGDVIQEIGLGADASIYTYVQHRITRADIWMRTESLATITRPEPLGGRFDQQPLVGSTIAPRYIGENYNSQFPLTLNGGSYQFIEGGSPTIVAVGLQDNSRVSDGSADGAAGSLATKLPLPQFMAYVPLMPGVNLQLRDVLHVASPLGTAPPDHYEVQKFLSTGGAGLIGYVCICDKIPL